MALQSLHIARRSGTVTACPSERHTVEVANLIDVSTCIGCNACQTACRAWNGGRDGVVTTRGPYDIRPELTSFSWTVMRYAEIKEGSILHSLVRKDGCMHCQEPGCLKTCPVPGAVVQYTNGIIDICQDKCNGCGHCFDGCPFNIPRLSLRDGKAYKCTLCSDRVAAGMEPACIKVCPTGALHFGAKERMREFAEERISDLKARGFAKAGLYDPSGVGGTHVMYVLHHADRPHLYGGLADKPNIDSLGVLRKGLAKPLAMTTLGAMAPASLFHYAAKGLNDVSGEPKDTPGMNGDSR